MILWGDINIDILNLRNSSQKTIEKYIFMELLQSYQNFFLKCEANSRRKVVNGIVTKTQIDYFINKMHPSLL